MKLFSWIRSKRNGNINNPNPKPNPIHDVMQESCKEEFSDWPNGLLAIGTFGNNNNSINLKQYSDDLEEQVEETELRVDASLDSSTPSSEKENLSVEQLLDCLRGGAHLESQISLVQRGGRNDIQSDKKSRGVGISSLSFLIKKALLCGGGFAAAAAAPPPPIIRDPLPYSKLDRSTMEKILRAMLQKKIHPQRPNTPTKYLDMAESESEDEQETENGSHQSKWVKTDSEYIVLEI